jgi:hypothetical protein
MDGTSTSGSGCSSPPKSKRQVIMVTNNANLVINTDADKFIVAERGPHQRGKLPDTTFARRRPCTLAGRLTEASGFWPTRTGPSQGQIVY